MPRARKRPRWFCLSWSAGKGGRFKNTVVARHDGVVPAGTAVIASATCAAGGRGEFTMSASTVWPVASGHWRPFRARRIRAFGGVPAIVLLLCTSLLVALQEPSKPFLEK